MSYDHKDTTKQFSKKPDPIHLRHLMQEIFLDLVPSVFSITTA
jgi:hypothetical protein